MEGYVSKEEQLRKKKNKENRDKIIEINQKAKELGIEKFTTSLVISPHKNFEKISNEK